METIKVMVVGAPRSGKSWLISRLVNRKLPQEYRPTVEQCSTTTHTSQDKQGKQYLLRFFEIGSVNEMLYRLYLTMCDIVLVTVDYSDPCPNQNATQILWCLRNSAISADRLKIITVTTKLESSNDCTILPLLGDLYPNIMTSALLNMCTSEVKNRIVALTKGNKSLSFKHASKRNCLKVSKAFQRLRARLDIEIDASLENLNCPSQVSDSKKIPTTFSTLLRGATPSFAESVGLSGEANKEHLAEFNESMILPKLLPGKRKFFHQCHVIEVPPIVFEKDEPKRIGTELEGYADMFRRKLECLW